MISTLNHTDRQTRLHSTDVSAILGLSPYTTDHTVWLEKTGRIDPWKGNSATDMGSRLEAPIVDLAESELGPMERQPLCIAQGLDFPLAATPDGRVIATGDVLDAKTSGIVGPLHGEWGDADSDVVPQYYLVQFSVQMLCAEADLHHTYALLGGRGVVRYRVNRDEDVTREIVERCGRWWHLHIDKGIEPTLTEPMPLEIIKRLRRQPSKTVELFDDAALAVAEYEAAKAVKSAAEKTCEVAQSKLIAMLGDAECGQLPDGREVCYLTQNRKGYTTLDTSFRVLRVRKGK